jgi:alpha-mannosidase
MKNIIEKLRAKITDLGKGCNLEWRYPPFEPSDPINLTDDPSWPIWTSTPPCPLKPGKKCWFYANLETPREHCGLALSRNDVLLRIGGSFPFTLWINGREIFKEEHQWHGTGPIAEPIPVNSGVKHRLVLCVEPGDLPNLSEYPNHGSGACPLMIRVAFRPGERMAWQVRAAYEELRFAEVLAGNDAERHLIDKAGRLIASDALERNDWNAVLSSIAAMESQLAPVFGPRAKAHVVHVIGHTHLDMDWMWTWPETVRCIRRDFKAITKLMDDYPEVCFTHSQVPTYQVVQTMDPDIFEKVKRFIAEGRWECVAGTWVEGDLGMADGEAIIRQILYAKNWTRNNLGTEARILWEPDTFGHPGNMPQMARLGEMPEYFHSRCNPNYHYFTPVREWEGFDGSTVLTANRGYGGSLHPSNIFEAARVGQRTGWQNSLSIIGLGDHGGGYNRIDMSYLKEYRQRPLTPTIIFSTMERYLEAVQKEGKGLPRQKGETYYMYSGCFTSVASIKKDNRYSENALLNAESLCAMAGIARKERLRDAWTPVLFSQFHDLLDGSAIKGAYADAHQRAEETMAEAETISHEAMAALAPAKEDGRMLTLVNPTAFARTEPVRAALPKDAVALQDEAGLVIPIQQVDDEYVFITTDILPFSQRTYTILRDLPAGTVFPAVTVANWGVPEDNAYRFREVETDYARVVLDTLSSALGSFIDKRTGLELVGACIPCALTGDRYIHHLHNGLNVFQFIDEHYNRMSSWNIDELQRVHYLLRADEVKLVETGPVFARFRVKHGFRHSKIEEEIFFYRSHPRIDFHITVDWREKASKPDGVPMLKLAFTTSMRAPEARFEGPFTIVERPVDGRELPTQKFLHISGKDFSYTLLNDCKYGCDVTGGVARFTLLRNPECPDPDPDTGVHTMRLAFHPHPAAVVANGQLFKLGVTYNRSLLSEITAEQPGQLQALVASSNPDIVITALRSAEYSKRLLVRIFETSGNGGETELSFHRPVKAAEIVNFLERPTGEAARISGRKITLHLRGFEIVNLLVELSH